MSKIGDIPANSTVTFNEQNLPEFLAIGQPTESAFAQIGFALQVNISGDLTYNATSQGLNEAIMGIGNAGNANGNQQFICQIANGGVGNKQVDITITNNTANAVELYGWSTSRNDGTVVKFDSSTIVGGSNAVYSSFEALAFQTANVESVEMEFVDGWKDRYSVDELFALYSMLNYFTISVEAGSTIALDNRLGFIKSARIYASESGNVGVAKKSYTVTP